MQFIATNSNVFSVDIFGNHLNYCFDILCFHFNNSSNRCVLVTLDCSVCITSIIKTLACLDVLSQLYHKRYLIRH
jgi:hypothetical protein